MSLDNKISELIESKREGAFWDFKREPHSNNANLLHDILCLSNCKHNGERYLIIGVCDPSADCKIIGVEGLDNRKTQAQLIDFIRTKKFAGDIRPELELKSVNIADKLIDVIVVYNSSNKPYYLTEDFADRGRKVKANFIYTRVIDTNTPIDKSADIYRIESMWRERFGLDLSPMDRMKLLLREPENWVNDLGNKDYAFHKAHPEFTVEYGEPKRLIEVYSFFYLNVKSYFGSVKLKYHSTNLFETEYTMLDEMRIHAGIPRNKFIKVGDQANWYFYFKLSEIDGLFHYWISNKLKDIGAARGGGSYFLCFKDDKDQNNFNDFLKSNLNTFDKINCKNLSNEVSNKMDIMKFESVIDPEFALKCKKLYDNWRIDNPLAL